MGNHKGQDWIVKTIFCCKTFWSQLINHIYLSHLSVARPPASLCRCRADAGEQSGQAPPFASVAAGPAPPALAQLASSPPPFSFFGWPLHAPASRCRPPLGDMEPHLQNSIFIIFFVYGSSGSKLSYSLLHHMMSSPSIDRVSSENGSKGFDFY